VLVGNRPERASIGSGRALYDATAVETILKAFVSARA
jgi:hypothetical protein